MTLKACVVCITIVLTVSVVVTSSAPSTVPVLKIKLVNDVSKSHKLEEDNAENGVMFKQHGRIITEREHTNGSQNIHVITLEEDNEISTLIVDGNRDLVVVRNYETCYVSTATATLELISETKTIHPVVLHFVGSQQIPREYFAVTSEPIIYDLCSDLPIWWSTVSRTHSDPSIDTM